MSSFFMGLLIGGFLGGIVGVLVTCLCVVAARADRFSERQIVSSHGTPGTPTSRVRH